MQRGLIRVLLLALCVWWTLWWGGLSYGSWGLDDRVRARFRRSQLRAAEKFWVTFWFRFEGALVSPSTCEVAPHGMTVLAHSQLVTDRGMNSGGGG